MKTLIIAACIAAVNDLKIERGKLQLAKEVNASTLIEDQRMKVRWAESMVRLNCVKKGEER